MSITDLIMLAGFCLAAYSIVANDSIQTLGTFIASNSKRPWWLLWIFSASVLAAVVMYGWLMHGGDPAYGRLEKFPVPEGGLQYYHVIPPLVILVLTRFGIPVSTTFLILAVFNPKNIDAMLLKSGLGYIVAFIVAIFVYRFVIKGTAKYFARTRDEPVQHYWIVLQWFSTAFLWSQWLVQDLANIFVYLPRSLELWQVLAAISVFVALQGIIFFQMGGAIQKIVNSKTGTADIRAATIIDFLYAIILLVFKEFSNMPMSTTWVFIGLLAGRQYAISLLIYKPPISETSRIVVGDALKALSGLVVSIVLALGLPYLAA
jgi:phosphate/sulfate permease